MRALCCVEPGRLDVIDVPPPQAPAGWARVAIAYVGICGTDYHIFEGTHPFLNYPRVIGHELSGRVVEPGDSGLKAGDAVVINPYLNCGTCVACRTGSPNCCETLKVLGVHTDGGMTEEIVVPPDHLYPTGGIELRDAAMVEFLAIGAHAVRRSEIHKGARVLVIGAGPIGLGTAIFARIAGGEVTILDAAQDKVASARGLGFSAAELSEVDGEAFKRARGTGFDIVLDATGSLRSMAGAIAYVRNGGALTLVGVTSGDLVWPDSEVHRRELTIRASRNATKEDFTHVMTSIEAGLVPTAKLATHATGFDKVAEFLPLWAKDRSGLIKAIVRL
jgi:2-desacetyl-2-hydroxyethyl bacteriochlorophyllide A dehydrogenase